jgi:outer membrane protease
MTYSKMHHCPAVAIFLAFCAILAGPVQPAAVQEKTWTPTISLDATTGVISGGATEYVYDSGYKMSELDWASTPLFYWGLGVDLRFPAGLYLNVGLKSGISGPTGYMTDSDWQNWDGVKTNFSESTSYTDQAFRLGVQAGWDFKLLDSLKIGPFLELGYLDYEWSARDGYVQYPAEIYPSTDSNGNPLYAPYTPISANTPIVDIYGIGIVYQQSTFYPALGFRVSYQPLDRLNMSASFAATPLVFMSETDNHVARSIIFTSTMSRGLLLEPRLDVEYRFTDALGLGLHVEYLRIQGLTGDLTQTDEYGNSSTNPSGAGAAWRAFDFGLSFKVRI